MNNALRAEWESAGYRRNMGSAAVVNPPPKEFIRVYYLTSAEFAISNIALGRLKVARFADLNDPFELMALNLREKRNRKIVRDFRNAYDSETGLLCFSADWTNPVLWSHYGAKHCGVCLGFDLKRSSTRKRSRVQKVQYKDKRIRDELGDRKTPLKIADKFQKQLVRTKFSHWEYEEEYRVFVPLKNTLKEGMMRFCNFDQNLQLAEVILGPQCNLSLKTVRQLTRKHYPHAVAYKARLAFKSFKVVPDARTVRTIGQPLKAVTRVLLD